MNYFGKTCSWCDQPAIYSGADGTLSCGLGADGRVDASGDTHDNRSVIYTPLRRLSADALKRMRGASSLLPTPGYDVAMKLHNHIDDIELELAGFCSEKAAEHEAGHCLTCAGLSVARTKKLNALTSENAALKEMCVKMADAAGAYGLVDRDDIDEILGAGWLSRIAEMRDETEPIISAAQQRIEELTEEVDGLKGELDEANEWQTVCSDTTVRAERAEAKLAAFEQAELGEATAVAWGCAQCGKGRNDAAGGVCHKCLQRLRSVDKQRIETLASQGQEFAMSNTRLAQEVKSAELERDAAAKALQEWDEAERQECADLRAKLDEAGRALGAVIVASTVRLEAGEQFGSLFSHAAVSAMVAVKELAHTWFVEAKKYERERDEARGELDAAWTAFDVDGGTRESVTLTGVIRQHLSDFGVEIKARKDAEFAWRELKEQLAAHQQAEREAAKGLPAAVREWQEGGHHSDTELWVLKSGTVSALKAAECLNWIARQPASAVARLGLRSDAAKAVRDWQRLDASCDGEDGVDKHKAMCLALERAQIYDVGELAEVMREFELYEKEHNGEHLSHLRASIVCALRRLGEHWKQIGR